MSIKIIRGIHDDFHRNMSDDDHEHLYKMHKKYLPLTDIFESDDAISMLLDLPGVDPAHINLEIDDNVLTVSATAISDCEHHLSYAEFPHRDYRRSFALPQMIDKEHIAADMKNGVLELTLPKRKGLSVRKIPITSS